MGWLKKLLWIETSWCNYRKKGHHGGIDTYRILMPSAALNKYSKKYKCETRGRIHKEGETMDQEYRRLFLKEGFDGIIIKNNNNVDSVLQLTAMTRKYNRKLIVDLDDDVLHIDQLNPAYKMYNECDAGLVPFKKLLKWANGIMVENRELQKAYVDYRTTIVPNCVDMKTVKKVKKYWKKKKNVNIGYFGSVSHKPDLDPYIPSINYILERFPEVNFVFFGGCPDNYNLKEIPRDRITLVPPEDDYPDFIKRLAKLDISIGISPLKKSYFNAGRSPLKYFEYTMAGIPVVAQGDRNLPYARVMEHGRNGLLFKTEKQFEECLETLITGNGLGQQLQYRAHHDLPGFSIQNNWQNWENFFDSVFEVKQ